MINMYWMSTIKAIKREENRTEEKRREEKRREEKRREEKRREEIAFHTGDTNRQCMTGKFAIYINLKYWQPACPLPLTRHLPIRKPCYIIYFDRLVKDIF